MALGATIYHFSIALSDVDRGVYESLDLRLARHPSESLRYLLTRTLAYCLSYEEGISFSKAGLSSVEEPPVLVPGVGGALKVWIDVGAPSARRLHKASKAAERVLLFTHVERNLLLAEATSSPIHRLEEIEVWRLEPSFLDPIAEKLDRKLAWSLTRSDGLLYLDLGGRTYESPLALTRLVPTAEEASP
ncbi:MAG TPA: YaeQ family protein [Polyangiaceae bacterium]|nr:YaeQ family protein [Polyangiaceae bacterium]